LDLIDVYAVLLDGDSVQGLLTGLAPGLESTISTCLNLKLRGDLDSASLEFQAAIEQLQAGDGEVEKMQPESVLTARICQFLEKERQDCLAMLSS